MSIWQDSNGGLHDDMDGTALSLPSWPQGMILLTDAQVTTVLAQQAASIAAAQAKLPNPQGFIQAAKTILGGPVAILNYPVALQNAISYCLQAVELGQWQDVHDIIAAFQTQIALANATAYPALKAAVSQFNLPVPALP